MKVFDGRMLRVATEDLFCFFVPVYRNSSGPFQSKHIRPGNQLIGLVNIIDRNDCQILVITEVA